MKTEIALFVLLCLAAVAICASPAGASVSIRQYYQAPVPSPYPYAHGGPNPYRQAPPPVQETWPQQVTPRGSPPIRMNPQ